jgi:Ca2+-binding RTX toxin-like protein
LDRQVGLYDGGEKWFIDHDELNLAGWKNYQDNFDAAGQIVSTRLVLDSGLFTTTYWANVNNQSGTAAGETLGGTADQDLIEGLSGNDILIGGGGADRLAGGPGGDAYYVDDPGDLVIENAGEGNDTVNALVDFILPAHAENLYLVGDALRGTGNDGNNLIVGNASANRLTGYLGNDNLVGRAGADTLVGGQGQDRLEGGEGADILQGGAGADTFIWRDVAEMGVTSSSADLLLDFSFVAGDRLNLALIDAVRGGTDQAFAFIDSGPFTAAGQISYFTTGTETRLILNTDSDSNFEGLIRLRGLHTPEASWFIL